MRTDKRHVRELAAVEQEVALVMAEKPLPDGLDHIASHSNLVIVPAVAEVVAVLRFPLFPLYKHVCAKHTTLTYYST